MLPGEVWAALVLACVTVCISVLGPGQNGMLVTRCHPVTSAHVCVSGGTPSSDSCHADGLLRRTLVLHSSWGFFLWCPELGHVGAGAVRAVLSL